MGLIVVSLVGCIDGDKVIESIGSLVGSVDGEKMGGPVGLLVSSIDGADVIAIGSRVG